MDKMFEFIPFISIIIPLYNTPIDSFYNCLKSIESQSYTNIEVIIIDDGSDIGNAKNYERIIKDIKIKNLKYYHIKNSGVSVARNEGIKHSSGDYIAFIDSDDIITISFLENAAKLAHFYHPDIVIGQIQRSEVENNYFLIDRDSIISGKNVLEIKKALFGMKNEIIDYRYGNILGSPCGRLYKREIFFRFLFSERIKLLEDKIFNRKCFDFVKTVVISPDNWYIYKQNNYSAMHMNSFASYGYITNMINTIIEWNEMNKCEKDQVFIDASYEMTSEMFFGIIRGIIKLNNLTIKHKIRFIKNILGKLELKQQYSKVHSFRMIRKINVIKTLAIKANNVYLLFALALLIDKTAMIIQIMKKYIVNVDI